MPRGCSRRSLECRSCNCLSPHSKKLLISVFVSSPSCTWKNIPQKKASRKHEESMLPSSSSRTPPIFLWAHPPSIFLDVGISYPSDIGRHLSKAGGVSDLHDIDILPREPASQSGLSQFVTAARGLPHQRALHVHRLPSLQARIPALPTALTLSI